MAVFAIMARQAQPPLGEAIEILFPDHIAWGPNVWLVQSDETAIKISQKLGVSDADDSGATTSAFGHIVVVKLASSYWGWATSEFWDWLQAAFEKAS